MNYKMIFSTIGKMLFALAILLILPVVVAIIYNEKAVFSFLLSAAIAAVLGLVLTLVFKTNNKLIYAREGFAIVSIVWILYSLIGALPFVLTGEIPSFVDAFFETVSGFTTTGASILVNVEALCHASLFWRSFTHWVGGMGVLVFALAIIPNISERSIHILRAEVPGPVVGKIVPRIKESSRILYIIYFVMTIVEIILLICGGMPVFDSIIHSFGTAGTGGFGIKADSIGGYSAYSQWIIAIFMLLFGINFNLYYFVIIKKIKTAIRSRELLTYLAIVLVSTVLVALNILPRFDNIWDTIRHAFFQVSSIITTTGFSTVDFNIWPTLSKTVLLILMFLGCCAGSTGGGIKISRVIILFKTIIKEIRRMLHPRSVNTIKFEGKQMDDSLIGSVSAYLAVYVACFLSVFLLISFEPHSIETNFSATAACFNNIGPGFGEAFANYAFYSDFSKIILSFAMLFGRLEIFPMLLLFVPTLWTKE